MLSSFPPPPVSDDPLDDEDPPLLELDELELLDDELDELELLELDELLLELDELLLDDDELLELDDEPLPLELEAVFDDDEAALLDEPSGSGLVGPAHAVSRPAAAMAPPESISRNSRRSCISGDSRRSAPVPSSGSGDFSDLVCSFMGRPLLG
jgi:hypothetical protein